MKYLFLFILSFSVHIATAQTVVWQMRPSDFSEICLVNSNLYKVVRNGKIGLIHSDGSNVAPIENDNISGFYEGKALLTANDGHGERVNGCLTEDGKYYPFSKKYYTLSGQKFFSDGVLSVANEQGKPGYIDESGNEVCGFDGKYDRIKPFVEGYAAVFKNKKYHLIDKEGVPVRFTFKSVGEVYGGTNVYNGLAYIWDTEGQFYTYDINREGPCKNVKTPQNTKSLDYLYRFSCISGLNKEIPFKNLEYSGQKGLNPLQNGGYYGYSNGQDIVLPCQFNSASPFEDGKAIIGINGKVGIIRYVEGSSFLTSEISKSLTFYAGKKVMCQFNIEIPEVWRNSKLEIVLKDQQGVSIETTHINNSFTFTQVLASSCKKEYNISIGGDGLKLYEGKLSYQFIKKEICPECGKDKEKCPGHPKIIKEGDKGHTSGTAEKLCPTCGKKISECKYQGVH